MKTALVIGGTGMLAGLTKKLTKGYDTVGVIGRDSAKFTPLKKFSRKIIGYSVDYSNTAALIDELNHFTGIHGRPELIVGWIHSTSPEAPLIVANYCSNDFYDVVSHDGAKPDHLSRQREKVIKAKGIKYHRVILGHKGNRWLTDQEISDGVYEAIKTGRDEFMVGEL